MLSLEEQVSAAQVCHVENDALKSISLLDDNPDWHFLYDIGSSRVYYNDECPNVEIFTGPASDAVFFSVCLESKNPHLLSVFSLEVSDDSYFAIVERLPEVDDDDDELSIQIVNSIIYTSMGDDHPGLNTPRDLKRAIKLLMSTNIPSSFGKLDDTCFGHRNRRLVIVNPINATELQAA